MENAFTLKGIIKDASSNKLPKDLFVAILDEDLLDDNDLIGVGPLNEQGAFSLSFVASEFRQHLFEDEATPNLQIVVSIMFGEERKAIFQQSFPNVVWNQGAADLGEVVMTNVNINKAVALENVEAIPGIDRRAERLYIDNKMVRDCLAEVAPIVEYLTGWSNLLDGVKVEVADSLAPYMLRESLKADGIEPDSWEAKFASFFANFASGPGAGCGLYDPHINTIIINQKIMSQVGIEGLKVICGHELVHVGQYKNTPGLKEYNLAHLRSMGLNPKDINPEEAKAKAAYMTELEGYAKYIESDFLHSQYYPMALMIYHASTFEKIFQALVAMALTGTDEARENKSNQYTDGREKYRAAQIDKQPARFHMNVADLPGGQAILDAL